MKAKPKLKPWAELLQKQMPMSRNGIPICLYFEEYEKLEDSTLNCQIISRLLPVLCERAGINFQSMVKIFFSFYFFLFFLIIIGCCWDSTVLYLHRIWNFNRIYCGCKQKWKLFCHWIDPTQEGTIYVCFWFRLRKRDQ